MNPEPKTARKGKSLGQIAFEAAENSHRCKQPRLTWAAQSTEMKRGYELMGFAVAAEVLLKQSAKARGRKEQK